MRNKLYVIRLSNHFPSCTLDSHFSTVHDVLGIAEQVCTWEEISVGKDC